jgi:hypothetical protein
MYVYMYVCMYVCMYIYTRALTHTHELHRNLLSVKYKLPELCNNRIPFDLYVCTWICLLLYNYATVFGPLLHIIDSFILPSRAVCNLLLSRFLFDCTWTPNNKLHWNVNNCCGVEWCIDRYYPTIFLQPRKGCIFFFFLPGAADGPEATVYMDLVTRGIKISLITVSNMCTIF